MKKFVMISIIILGIAGVAGYFGYQAVMDVAADKLVDQVANNLSEEEINQLKEDPEIKALINRSTGDLSKSDLPVKTKEEAIEMVNNKLSAGEIKDLALKASDGLTSEEKKQIKSKLEEKLTPEEMKALKALAISELSK